MQKSLKVIFSLFLLSVFLLQPFSAFAQDEASFSVSPPKIEITIDPGISAEAAIRVLNSGKIDLNFRAYLQDYRITEKNEFVFSDPGHESYSCASWITLDKTSFLLKGGEDVEVKMTLNVPENAEPGGHYAMIFFETSAAGAGKEGATVGIAGRIGTAVLAFIGGDIIRKGSIESFTASSSGLGKPVKLTVLFKNEGNIHLNVGGKITIKDIFGRDAGSVDLGAITVLPKTKRELTAEWKNPPLWGIYRASAEMTFADKTETVHTGIYLIPWLILAAIAVVLGLIYIILKKVLKIKIVVGGPPSSGGETSTPAVAPEEKPKEKSAKKVPRKKKTD
ncbi:MAG: hypothetical protein Q8M92_08140 [Candidatus Subteraquimicrobiales bacterium]|nr:hypothetical protein [Candidatus Subteraquimicrobiales bacterium]